MGTWVDLVWNIVVYVVIIGVTPTLLFAFGGGLVVAGVKGACELLSEPRTGSRTRFAMLLLSMVAVVLVGVIIVGGVAVYWAVLVSRGHP